MLGRWLVGFVALGTLAMAACAAPPPAKKKAAICDPAKSECAGEGPRAPQKDGNLKTTTGAPLEAPDKAKSTSKPADGATGDDDDDTTEVPLPPERPDIPVEEPTPEPELGPMCTKLKTCCKNLRDAGITGSAGQCDTTVKANDEITCDIQNENYKTPDDFYDPVCF